jgi:predicted RNA-binding Zn-ribbon protein involved in translation (DUF1610 family)
MDLSKLVMDAVKSQQFDIDCPNCGKKLSICLNDGKTIPCPKCSLKIKLKG